MWKNFSNFKFYLISAVVVAPHTCRESGQMEVRRGGRFMVIAQPAVLSLLAAVPISPSTVACSATIFPADIPERGSVLPQHQHRLTTDRNGGYDARLDLLGKAKETVQFQRLKLAMRRIRSVC